MRGRGIAIFSGCVGLVLAAWAAEAGIVTNGSAHLESRPPALPASPRPYLVTAEPAARGIVPIPETPSWQDVVGSVVQGNETLSLGLSAPDGCGSVGNLNLGATFVVSFAAPMRPSQCPHLDPPEPRPHILEGRDEAWTRARHRTSWRSDAPRGLRLGQYAAGWRNSTRSAASEYPIWILSRPQGGRRFQEVAFAIDTDADGWPDRAYFKGGAEIEEHSRRVALEFGMSDAQLAMLALGEESVGGLKIDLGDTRIGGRGWLAVELGDEWKSCAAWGGDVAERLVEVGGRRGWNPDRLRFEGDLFADFLTAQIGSEYAARVYHLPVAVRKALIHTPAALWRNLRQIADMPTAVRNTLGNAFTRYFECVRESRDLVGCRRRVESELAQESALGLFRSTVDSFDRMLDEDPAALQEGIYTEAGALIVQTATASSATRGLQAARAALPAGAGRVAVHATEIAVDQALSTSANDVHQILEAGVSHAARSAISESSETGVHLRSSPVEPIAERPAGAAPAATVPTPGGPAAVPSFTAEELAEASVVPLDPPASRSRTVDFQRRGGGPIALFQMREGYRGEFEGQSLVYGSLQVERLTDAQRAAAEVRLASDGRFVRVSDGLPPEGTRAGIFVVDWRGKIIQHEHAEVGHLHHSSLTRGWPMQTGGALELDHGRLAFISNMSGHYLPPPESTVAFLERMKRAGADLSSTQVALVTPGGRIDPALYLRLKVIGIPRHRVRTEDITPRISYGVADRRFALTAGASRPEWQSRIASLDFNTSQVRGADWLSRTASAQHARIVDPTRPLPLENYWPKVEALLRERDRWAASGQDYFVEFEWVELNGQRRLRGALRDARGTEVDLVDLGPAQ
ncbi:MAG: hypothetical protein AB7P04_01795 [Bacteriovoracia bacterium]